MALRTFIAALSVSILIHLSIATAQSPPQGKSYYEQQRKQYRDGVLSISAQTP